MKEGLRGLTLRGQLLLATALVVAVGSVLLGQRDFLRVAVLMALLPVVSAVLVVRARLRVTCDRTLTSTRLERGHHAEVSLTFTNTGARPSRLLLVADDVPAALGEVPRVVLDRIERGGQRDLTYRINGIVRGRHRLGPASVTITDPFGLCRVTRRFRSTDAVVVTPPVTPLPAATWGGSWSGSGESRARRLGSAGQDDVIPREYRTGDDLRRVHWSATAKAGDLMVRREEEPWRLRALLVLDTRAEAWLLGPGTPDRYHRAAEAFEHAVDIAASIGVHLLRRGIAVRVIDVAGRDLTGPGITQIDVDHEGVLLDALALARPLRAEDRGEAGTLRHLAGEGLTALVLGMASAGQVERLSRLREGGASAVCLQVLPSPEGNRDSTPVAEDAEAPTRLLRRVGWRATATTAAEDPAVAWTRALNSSLDLAGAGS